MQPFYRFDGTCGNPRRCRSQAPGDRSLCDYVTPLRKSRCEYRFDSGQVWSIVSIRPIDLPLRPSRFKLRRMTVLFATACFALLAAVLHFVSYKLKKTAERKSFHVKDAV
jgi:hypothetical protein